MKRLRVTLIDFERNIGTSQTFDMVSPVAVPLQTDGLVKLQVQLVVDGGGPGVVLDQVPLLTARFVTP